MSSINSNLITVTIELLDGRKEDVTISKTKPVAALIEKAVGLKEGPISGLMKNGVTISSREMIKFVPLVSGDTVKEAPAQATSLKNLPAASFKNTILRGKVKSGQIPASDVIELRVIYDDITTGGLKSVNVLIRKTATIDELKDAISQLIRRPIKELGAENQQGFPSLFGWTNLDNTSRSYNRSMTVDNLGITGNTTIQEYDLPAIPTGSKLLEIKLARGEISEKDVIRITFDDYYGGRIYKKLIIPKHITVDQLKKIIREEVPPSKRPGNWTEISVVWTIHGPQGRGGFGGASGFDILGYKYLDKYGRVAYDGSTMLDTLNVWNANGGVHLEWAPPLSSGGRDDTYNTILKQLQQQPRNRYTYTSTSSSKSKPTSSSYSRASRWNNNSNDDEFYTNNATKAFYEKLRAAAARGKRNNNFADEESARRFWEKVRAAERARTGTSSSSSSTRNNRSGAGAGTGQRQQQQQQPPVKVEKDCKTILKEYGITNKKTLKTFLLKYHPDKSAHAPGSKEYLEAEEIFKLVYGCAEKETFEGGARKTRKRKNRKQRKQKSRKY